MIMAGWPVSWLPARLLETEFQLHLPGVLEFRQAQDSEVGYRDRYRSVSRHPGLILRDTADRRVLPEFFR